MDYPCLRSPCRSVGHPGVRWIIDTSSLGKKMMRNQVATIDV